MSDLRRMAEDDFHKARNKELFHGLLSLLSNQKDDLLSFRDVLSILKPKSETYRGMNTVPIERIVGSEGRYHDFNRRFLPRRGHLKARWTNIGIAHYQSVDLPPIKLYELGGVYFVRDGNHRVSVAKTRGVEFIDAEVVSLNSEVQLEPQMDEAALRSKVIEFEKTQFFTCTELDRLRPDCELDFTAPGRYDEIVMHINGHKYFINQDKKDEIAFQEGMLSWYDTVYRPIVTIVKEKNVLTRFPGRTAADLYVWTVRHWDALKKKYGQGLTMQEAVQDFSVRYGKTHWARLQAFLQRLFKAK